MAFYKKNKQLLGRSGEAYVCKALKRKKCFIVSQNWFCRMGEIDIITKTLENKYIFIEVRTRHASHETVFTDPENVFPPKKIQKFFTAVEYYCSKHYVSPETIHGVYGVLVLIDPVLPRVKRMEWFDLNDF